MIFFRFKVLEVNYGNPRVKNYIQKLEEHLGFMVSPLLTQKILIFPKFQPDFLGENWKQKQAHYFIDKDSVEKVKINLADNNITYHMRGTRSLFRV